MKTKILKSCNLSLALKYLRQGEPIIFPTETVYGLGAPLFQEEAVRKIFSLKNRPKDNPLIVHIIDLKDIVFLTSELPKQFYLLAEKFWPGPLTIVLRKGANIPSIVSAGQPTIAIRMPAHPIAEQLIRLFQEPLVAPSANLSTKPSPTRLEDALEDFEGKVKIAIDGGECKVGIESSVIALHESKPLLLRPGKITKNALEDVLKQKICEPDRNTLALSPGMKYRHYSPKAAIELVTNSKDLKKPYIEPTAANLYQLFRESDRRGLKTIQIYLSPKVRQDEGLMDRLLRAAGQMI